MASPCLPRFLGRATSRSVFKARRQFVQTTSWRAASTKHPNGFTPPTDEELVELRESVQDFASKKQKEESIRP